MQPDDLLRAAHEEWPGFTAALTEAVTGAVRSKRERLADGVRQMVDAELRRLIQPTPGGDELDRAIWHALHAREAFADLEAAREFRRVLREVGAEIVHALAAAGGDYAKAVLARARRGS